MKPIKLSTKEIRRASNGFTVVVRPQAKGGLYMVAVVRVATGMPSLRPSIVEGAGIAGAVKNELRMIDKCGFDCPMADASRHR